MRWTAAVAILVTVLGLGVAPAAAHSQLVSTLPADGTAFASPPTEVRFTFNENLMDGLTTLAIIDSAGNVVTSTSITPNGTDLVLPWPADLGRGTWQVSYRVVSADGHPVSGAITFTVGTGSSTSAEKAPSTTDGSVTLWLVGGAILVATIAVLVMAWRRSHAREVH